MTGPTHAVSVYRKASAFARAIVAKRVTILAGAGIILGELVRAGILPDRVSGQVATILGITLDALGVITGIVWAQSGTTPADQNLQPTSSDGQLLVPYSAVSKTIVDLQAKLAKPVEIKLDGKVIARTSDGAAPADSPTTFPLTPVPTVPEESA